MFCFFFLFCVELKIFNSIYNVNQKVLVIYVWLFVIIILLSIFFILYSLLFTIKIFNRQCSFILIYPLILFCTHCTYTIIPAFKMIFDQIMFIIKSRPEVVTNLPGNDNFEKEKAPTHLQLLLYSG